MSIVGKYDFQDCVEMSAGVDFINNCKIYAYGNDVIPLNFEKPEDLIAYYTYPIGISTVLKREDGSRVGVIHLGSQSFIDTFEKESLGRMLRNVQIIYRRCKRKKVTFDEEAARKAVRSHPDDPLEDYEFEIIDRVKKYGDKATTDDLHIPYYDKMRDKWYQLMIKNEWDEEIAYKWVYGWKRYLEKIKNDQRTL